ncbi:hypothetical protein [Mesorhizobium sp. M0659]|uniref:hypothetical protein n=1 Tax=Mesorhizobium sp. M0659 TaxID=2956980 RepID=UPI0033382874
MVYAAEHDPLCYPGTTVLRNRLNIKDQARLDEFELALFLTRADEHIPAGRLDFEHYKAVHHHLFQDVYEWAGEVRAIRIGKGGATGSAILSISTRKCIEFSANSPT